jgi:hypothetical protein
MLLPSAQDPPPRRIVLVEVACDRSLLGAPASPDRSGGHPPTDSAVLAVTGPFRASPHNT